MSMQIFAFQATLADTNPHSVASLLAASTVGARLKSQPTNFAQVDIQGDPANSTTNILVGDETLSTTNYGRSLVSGTGTAIFSHWHPDNAIGIADLFVCASVANGKVNIVLRRM